LITLTSYGLVFQGALKAFLAFIIIALIFDVVAVNYPHLFLDSELEKIRKDSPIYLSVFF
jgi:hypothetical protein